MASGALSLKEDVVALGGELQLTRLKEVSIHACCHPPRPPPPRLDTLAHDFARRVLTQVRGARDPAAAMAVYASGERKDGETEYQGVDRAVARSGALGQRTGDATSLDDND